MLEAAASPGQRSRGLPEMPRMLPLSSGCHCRRRRYNRSAPPPTPSAHIQLHLATSPTAAGWSSAKMPSHA
eukprot:363596-Chlamydomonas_euryale.AAC.12